MVSSEAGEWRGWRVDSEALKGEADMEAFWIWSETQDPGVGKVELFMGHHAIRVGKLCLTYHIGGCISGNHILVSRAWNPIKLLIGLLGTPFWCSPGGWQLPT